MPFSLADVLMNLDQFKNKTPPTLGGNFASPPQPVPAPQTLANQNAPVAPAPQNPMMPPQPPASLPGMPNFGQNAGAGGWKGFLKDTLSEIIPAATQVAIWGPGEFGQRMAYNKLVTHLGKKKEDEEKQKQDMIAQSATAQAGVRMYLKANKIDPDMFDNALLTGGSTGNQQADSWIQQYRTQLEPWVKANKFGPADMLKSFESRKAYEDLYEEKGVLGEKAFEQKKELKMVGRRPPTLTYRERDPEGWRKDQEFKADLKATHMKPDKPETPSMREVWPTGGGESIWTRNDVAPPKGYTGIKPERAPKAPTPQQALKNIAQQEKIIFSLKNTGGIPAELLGNVSPETLKMLQGGDSTSAIQAAQDVIDYNKPYAAGKTEATGKPKVGDAKAKNDLKTSKRKPGESIPDYLKRTGQQ